MPAASNAPSALERQLLAQLGDRLRRPRKEQGLSAAALAERAGISRMTLSGVEAGEPSPTIGTYLRVMSALGMGGDLALLASDAPPTQAHAKPRKLVTKASAGEHDIQDLQSLLLHQEAVKLVRKRPELISRALETLEKWRASGNVHSRVLWDEWSVILHRREWRRILAATRRSKELRQASPLTVLLPDDVRDRVLDEVRKLKKGVHLHRATSLSKPRKAAAKKTK